MLKNGVLLLVRVLDLESRALDGPKNRVEAAVRIAGGQAEIGPVAAGAGQAPHILGLQPASGGTGQPSDRARLGISRPPQHLSG